MKRKIELPTVGKVVRKKNAPAYYPLFFVLILLAQNQAVPGLESFAASNSPPPPPQIPEDKILSETVLNTENSPLAASSQNEEEQESFLSAPPNEEEETAEQKQKSLEDLQSSIEKLQSEVENLQSDIQKKQNKPDSSKKFTAQIGGFLESDVVTIDQNDLNKAIYGDINNDFNVRDVRLWVKGEGYGNLGYEVALGFNGTLSFKNVMLTASGLPVFGDTKFGYFKVESGLNFLQNVYNNTFVDWETNDKAFSVGRRLGIGSVHYTQSKNIRLFTGIFTGQNLQFGDDKYSNENNDNPGLILNTRLSSVPLYKETEDGALEEVLHLGTGFRWVDAGRNSETGAVRITTLKSSPTDWLSDMPALLRGSIQTKSYTTTNVEAAYQRKQLGLIGEGFFGIYEGYDNSYGVSATCRYLLTHGAFQKYNKENGVFGGISIPENLQFINTETRKVMAGPGVWEVAAQWAWTDFGLLRDSMDAEAVYGRMNQYMVALNWYWNPQTRWGINWILAKPISSSLKGTDVNSALNTLAFQGRITF